MSSSTHLIDFHKWTVDRLFFESPVEKDTHTVIKIKTKTKRCKDDYDGESSSVLTDLIVSTPPALYSPGFIATTTRGEAEMEQKRVLPICLWSHSSRDRSSKEEISFTDQLASISEACWEHLSSLSFFSSDSDRFSNSDPSSSDQKKRSSLSSSILNPCRFLSRNPSKGEGGKKDISFDGSPLPLRYRRYRGPVLLQKAIKERTVVIEEVASGIIEENGGFLLWQRLERPCRITAALKIDAIHISKPRHSSTSSRPFISLRLHLLEVLVHFVPDPRTPPAIEGKEESMIKKREKEKETLSFSNATTKKNMYQYLYYDDDDDERGK